jgi:hypothetical protein
MNTKKDNNVPLFFAVEVNLICKTLEVATEVKLFATQIK